jgi:hypothetical protein
MKLRIWGYLALYLLQLLCTKLLFPLFLSMSSQYHYHWFYSGSQWLHIPATKRTLQSVLWNSSWMTFQNMSDPDGSVIQWSRRGTHTWQMCECSELHISHKLQNETEVICFILKTKRWVTKLDSTRHTANDIHIILSTKEQAMEQINWMVLNLNGKPVLASFQPSEPQCTALCFFFQFNLFQIQAIHM